jgi:hypothetical protein
MNASPLQTPWFKALVASLVALVLTAVFMFYFQPDVLIALTNQVWACF